MDRETINQLSEDEKVEVILRLQQSLAALEARVIELEAQLKRPRKTSKNSSLPASRQPKANTANQPGKKRGPKPGHPGKSRPRSTPDVTLECRLETCPSCGAKVSMGLHQEAGRSQVIEIPPIDPVVIEAVSYDVQCPCCGSTHRTTYPEGLEPHRVFGPTVEALVIYLRQVHHLSFERLETVFEAIFGLSISQGALNNILQRTAQMLQPAAERIKTLVVSSPVVGSDETSARGNGQNRWEWVFQTPTASYHRIGSTRSADEIESVMGDHQVDVWVSDLYSAQLKGARTYADAFAMCGAHQLRDLQFAIDCGDTLFAPAFRLLLLEAKALAEQRDHLPPPLFQEQVACVHATCDHLLSLGIDIEASQNLQRRYTQHRPSIFVFLDRPDVPFDNNASERALRNSVIHRKVTGGFRSNHGPDAFAITTTIVQTARKNHLPILDTLRSLLSPSPLNSYWAR